MKLWATWLGTPSRLRKRTSSMTSVGGYKPSSAATGGCSGTIRWASTVVPTWAPCSVMTELQPAIRWTKLSRYSCRMAGRVTYVPRPCSRTRWPSATRPSTARRRVIRLTPYSAQSTGSGGSRVCSGSAVTRRRRCSRTERYFGPETGLTTAQRYGMARRLVVMSYETFHRCCRPPSDRHAADTRRQDVMTYGRASVPSRAHPWESRVRIGVLTRGGDSPGPSRHSRARVRMAWSHYGSEVVGFRDGWRGLLE